MWADAVEARRPVKAIEVRVGPNMFAVVLVVKEWMRV